MELTTLNDVANAMVADGKGILAADESTGTCLLYTSDAADES